MLCEQQCGNTHKLKSEYFSALLSTTQKFIGVLDNNVELFRIVGSNGKMFDVVGNNEKELSRRTEQKCYDSFSNSKGTVYLN